MCTASRHRGRSRAPLLGLTLIATLGFHGAAVAHPPSEHPPDDRGEFGYSPAAAPQGGSFEAWGRCPPEGDQMHALVSIAKVVDAAGPAEGYDVFRRAATEPDHTWRLSFAVPHDAPPGQYVVRASCWIDDHPVGDHHSHPFEVRAAPAPPPTTSTSVPATTVLRRPTSSTSTAAKPSPPTTVLPTTVPPPPPTTAVPSAPPTTIAAGTAEIAGSRPTDRDPTASRAVATALAVAATGATALAVARRRRS